MPTIGVQTVITFSPAYNVDFGPPPKIIQSSDSNRTPLRDVQPGPLNLFSPGLSPIGSLPFDTSYADQIGADGDCAYQVNAGSSFMPPSVERANIGGDNSYLIHMNTMDSSQCTDFRKGKSSREARSLRCYQLFILSARRTIFPLVVKPRDYFQISWTFHRIHLCVVPFTTSNLCDR
jgi:hypothetical protein